MKKVKNLFAYPSLFLAWLYFFAYKVNAQTFDADRMFGLRYAKNVGLPEQADPISSVVGLVKLLLTFLGLLALIIILYGGFLWMTAAGNEERVQKAKRVIGAAIVGLVVIIAAYIIISFVITKIAESLAG